MNTIVFILVLCCFILTILLIREKKGCPLFGRKSNFYRRCSLIFDSLTIGIVIYNKRGYVEYLNTATIKLFGLSDEYLLNKKISLYNNPVLTEELRNNLMQGAEINSILEYSPQDSSSWMTRSQTIYVDTKARYIKNKKGKIDKYVFILNDITNNKNREMQLEHSELNLRMSLKAGEISVWRYDIKQSKFYSVYGNMFVLEGANIEDIEAVMYKEHYNVFVQTMSDILLGKIRESESVCRILDKNGKNKYYKINITTRYDSAGNLSMIIGSHKDISDDYYHKQELTETLLKTRLAIKSSNIIQWDYNPDVETLCIFDANSNNVTITSDINDYCNNIHPDDRDSVVSYFHTMLHDNIDEGSIDARLKIAGYDSWQYIAIDGVLIKDDNGDVVRLTGFLRNNTKFVELNEQFREKNIHLNMVLKAGDITPIVFDCNTNKIHFPIGNEGSKDCDIIDFDAFIANIHPDDRDSTVKILEDIKLGVINSIHNECHYVTNGVYDDIYDANYLGIDYDRNGKPSKIVGYIQNISKRKAIENNVNKQREFMISILDKLPIPIHIKDVEDDFKYIYWNQESRRLFGDMLFRSARDIVGEDKAMEMEKIDKHIFETGESYIAEEIIEKKDGVQYDMNVYKDVVYHGDKKYLLIVRWDINTKEELQRKSKILSISMNALKAFTWYYDLRDGVLRFGEEFEQIGGNHFEMNSMSKFAQRIHPDYRDDFMAFIGRFVVQDSGDFVVEYKIDINNEGAYEWWECRGTIDTITSGDSSYKYMYGMDINIDNHKQTEIKLDNLNKQNELILNNTNQGLVFLDNNYQIQWQNITSYMPNLPFLANYKKGSVCHQIVGGLDYPCPGCVVMKSRMSGTTEIKEIVWKDRVAELTAIPIYDDFQNLSGTVLKIVDITEKKKIHIELEMAKNKAEQSNMLKSAFLANMSHEIRTPLNSIVGFSELLVGTDDESEKETYFNIINTNNELLLCLINDILDLSKIEVGMINLNPIEFDVTDLFNEISMTLRNRITNSNVELICEIPYKKCVVVLDKNRFTQVITNFVTNSIKFTKMGYIKMSYEYVEGELMVTVKDTGIGISKDNIGKVFERFEKLDDFAQGTGLGMAISKAIIDAHNGEIGVNSQENKGSEFWIKIPVAAIVER